jgi:dTDP-4-amino-4,6-dideoxygalactose transaminase
VADIPLSRVYVNQEMKEKVLEVIDSGRFILGSQCKEFEKAFASYIGTAHGALASSCTAAVQMLLMALGVKAGDEVIVPSLTAFPTAEAVHNAGGKPVFADVDDAYTMDPAALESLITKNTVGIMPVHLYGHPCDLDGIMAVARKHGLFVVEDCAQAHGAVYKGKKVGGFTVAGAFSFYPSKNLTVFGDGGIITTSDNEVDRKIRMLRNHGRAEKYINETFGFNLRFNEMQAAVGLVQLAHIDEMNDRRRRAAGIYNELLKDLPVETPAEKPYAKHVYHIYRIQTERRDELQEFLEREGIATGIHYPVPVHRQPAVETEYGTQPELPRTEECCRKILSLPMYPGITEDQIQAVAKAIKKFFEG